MIAPKNLLAAIEKRSAIIGIVGLGYVGLPLAIAAARAEFRTIGFDVDPLKPPKLNAGQSYIGAVSDLALQNEIGASRFEATADFARLRECDVIVICVPTPLSRYREPDLSYVEGTAKVIADHLRNGQIIILESTSYPGTTSDVVKPILESAGLKCGRDFFVGFSPEREDPGNTLFETVTIPKVVAGDGEEALALVTAFYAAVVKTVVPVSSPATAEAVKITENIFRAVNIALVNELKVIYSAMGIDIWEVIDAAKTKPFGFMPFYPGPGLGGHCIPIDPFYLAWKSREHNLPTRFIELAGEINHAMPHYVVEELAKALDKRLKVPLSVARILIVGIAYKKNVPDIRESASFTLMQLLDLRGADISYHDPLVPQIPKTREFSRYEGKASTPLTPDTVREFDAILIATDHDAIDYSIIARNAKMIVDTRNVMARKGFVGQNILKA